MPDSPCLAGLVAPDQRTPGTGRTGQVQKAGPAGDAGGHRALDAPWDRFDPADPWFDDPAPSRQGLSFSRRYGLVMDARTDPLPANTVIWLRRLSGDPALGFYRYSGSAPRRWEPIFGTAGSPSALAWNGMMFHPAVTAPPGTNTFTAVFEAYLADATTGAEIPHPSSGPFEFHFTNVPDGRPVLAIAARWPSPGPPTRRTGSWNRPMPCPPPSGCR